MMRPVSMSDNVLKRDKMALSRTDKLWENQEDCENYEYVHCTLLGDGLVGKTCLTHSFTQQVFTDHYTATVFDNYAVPVRVGERDFVISVFDSAGQSDYESLRVYTYNTSEVLVLCYSVCDRQSFCSIVNFWLPEIQRHTKRKRPLLLVGTQMDLRGSSSDSPEEQVSAEEGSHLAKLIGADCYIECSARSQEGLQQVFEHVVLSALKYRRKKGKLFSKLFSERKLSSKTLCRLSAQLSVKSFAT